MLSVLGGIEIGSLIEMSLRWQLIKPSVVLARCWAFKQLQSLLDACNFDFVLSELLGFSLKCLLKLSWLRVETIDVLPFVIEK